MSETTIPETTETTIPGTTIPGTTTPDLTERLFGAAIGTLELISVHLGTELGLYASLDRQGPATSTELAERTGIAERYAREWLEQQAVAGLLVVVDGDDAATRRYALPAAHRGALLDPVDGDHAAPFAPLVIGIAAVVDEVLEAYRSGGGVPYERYGATFRHGQGGINRPAFTTDLVKAWLPAVAGVTDRLASGGRVIDLGTGHGWSAIAVKAAWPAAEVIGLDTDEGSIADARRHAADADTEVRFEVATDSGGGDLGSYGPADVILVLETLHDMSRPVEVLAAARANLAPGGVVVIADEAVAETFTAPGDELERIMYGWSVSHCLPASMAEQPSAALGTALRPATVVDLAHQAGFATCETVDVDGGFFRIYRLAG
jgi:2-polyprenyl-3-methyl-5-hydroxy-6-metoxy-1,4-benzoquinol methylase